MLPAHLVPDPELVKLVMEALEWLLGPVATAEALVALVLAPPPLQELLQEELGREGDARKSSVAEVEVDNNDNNNNNRFIITVI